MSTPFPAPSSWRKSTESGENECVEVAFLGEQILVRQSRDPSGPKLAFTEAEWRAFVAGVRNGEFDRA